MIRAALIVFISLALFGCGETKPKTVYVLMFDVSGSTNDEQRKAYGTYTSKVYDHVSKADSKVPQPSFVTSALISNNSLANEQMILEITTPTNGFNDTPEKFEQLKLKNNADVEKSKQKLMESTNSHTEILDSLDFAQRAFARYPEANKNLIMFSDMQEQSNRYDFTRYIDKFPDEEISRIIASEKNLKMLPNLTGVHVTVCGAKAANSVSYRRIREFWIQYFKATGAQLKAEDYGTVLSLEK